MSVVEVSGCCVSRVLVVAVKVLSNYWRKLCAIQVPDIKLMSDNFEKAHESDTERVWLARLHLRTLSSHHELFPNYVALRSPCSVILSMNFKVTLLGI